MAKHKSVEQTIGDAANVAPAEQTNGALPVVPTAADTNGKQPKPQEPKADKWKRLANKRVPRLVKAMFAVANLSRSAQYEFTEEQREQLLGIVKEAYDHLVHQYRRSQSPIAASLLFG